MNSTTEIHLVAGVCVCVNAEINLKFSNMPQVTPNFLKMGVLEKGLFMPFVIENPGSIQIFMRHSAAKRFILHDILLKCVAIL